jgi:hypothetical protein
MIIHFLIALGRPLLIYVTEDYDTERKHSFMPLG